MTKSILIARKDVRDTLSAIPKTIVKLCGLFHTHGCIPHVIAENISKSLVENAHGTPLNTFKFPLLTPHMKRLAYSAQVERWRKKNRPALTIGHGDIIRQDVLFMHNCVHKASELIHKKNLSEKSAIGRIHHAIMTQKHFKVLICNSQLMLDDFTSRYDLSGVQTTIIHPELDTDAFAVNPDDIQAIRQEQRAELGIDQASLVIGLITSGDFVKRNVNNALRAFAMLPHEQYSLKLLVAGKNETASYSALAEQLGIGNKVVFGPAIPEVQRYYHACDIFLLPAFIEEFGKSVLEAMYCQKPVVIGKNVGAAEILTQQSREGIIDDVNQAEQITAKLLPLVVSPELRLAMGQENHTTSLQYTSEKQMQRYADLFIPMLS